MNKANFQFGVREQDFWSFFVQLKILDVFLSVHRKELKTLMNTRFLRFVHACSRSVHGLLNTATATIDEGVFTCSHPFRGEQ